MGARGHIVARSALQSLPLSSPTDCLICWRLPERLEVVLAGVFEGADRAGHHPWELGVHREEGVVVHQVADDVHLLLEVLLPYLSHAQGVATWGQRGEPPAARQISEVRPVRLEAECEPLPKQALPVQGVVTWVGRLQQPRSAQNLGPESRMQG